MAWTYEARTIFEASNLKDACEWLNKHHPDWDIVAIARHVGGSIDIVHRREVGETTTVVSTSETSQLIKQLQIDVVAPSFEGGKWQCRQWGVRRATRETNHLPEKEREYGTFLYGAECNTLEEAVVDVANRLAVERLEHSGEIPLS